MHSNLLILFVVSCIFKVVPVYPCVCVYKAITIEQTNLTFRINAAQISVLLYLRHLEIFFITGHNTEHSVGFIVPNLHLAKCLNNLKHF